jgi:hypothetical protein
MVQGVDRRAAAVNVSSTAGAPLEASEPGAAHLAPCTSMSTGNAAGSARWNTPS